mgnify:CR=1 FL=1
MTSPSEFSTNRVSTAIAMTGVVELPITKLYDEQVPIGSRVGSFGPDHPDFGDLMFACEESSTREASQHSERPFMLWQWQAKAVELVDQKTQEKARCVRLVLISHELETMSFASVGASNSLDLLRCMKGDGPYEPPLPVICKSERTRGGMNIWRLRIAKKTA